MLKAVLYDFGGVLADEGFREGIKAIGRREGVDQEGLFRMAEDLIYETGYLTGKAPESAFWAALRERGKLKSSDEEFRAQVLGRFTIRQGVLKTVDDLRKSGLITGILSDQTDWLEELDARIRFSLHFDRVFNSFRVGKGKRDVSLFRDVAAELGLDPPEILFIDDKRENLERAEKAGMKTLLFKDAAQFRLELRSRLETSGALS